jgi:hypothetical protein
MPELRKQIETILQELAGYASVCWDPGPGDGVFQSEEALKACNEATDKIMELISDRR